MEYTTVQQKVAAQWERYRRADWRGKLTLLQHRVSMYVIHADQVLEDLHIVLDDHTKLQYMVNKGITINDEHSLKGFVREVFALKEGETKQFIWVTTDGYKEWILSRDDAALYVATPEIEEGFFIRYHDFRDNCFFAYKHCYGWGNNAEIRRIEVPAPEFDFLHTLDVQDEFELVRFFNDGTTFETTDAERLLRYLEEQREMEAGSDEPDEVRLRSFRNLITAIQYYVTEHKRKRRRRTLRSTTGNRLSELKYNWEECDFRYNVSMKPDDWHDAVYRRYGDLPDGRHFGVYIWPKHEEWPPESAMMIVSKTGEMQVNTGIDDRWEASESDRWPLAAAASPSGKCIVWLKDDDLRAWREDRRDRRFYSDEEVSLKDRIGGLPVTDAYMRTDGILVLFAEGDEGKGYAYLCDEDIVLVRHEDCWIPADKSEAPGKGQVEYWPDSFAIMICRDDEEYEYYSCGVRQVVFEPGLEVIKPGMLADNPNLTSVTIPASVKEVQSWAFGCCTNLKDLVIEGDLTRVADWAPDAFDCCACEEQYLRMRNAN